MCHWQFRSLCYLIDLLLSSRFKRFKKRKNILPVSDQQEPASWERAIDPQGQFLQTWNKIFMLSGVISMALDPLFFYIPVIHDKDKCLDSDLKLAIIACVLRSLFDAFYVLHIISQFHTGYNAPSSTCFVIDILSILPLPQVCMWHLINMKVSKISFTSRTLWSFCIHNNIQFKVQS